MTHATNRVGRIGERLAVRRLEGAGMVVVARNWRCPDQGLRGELDIVALAPGDVLVFCEVKTRRTVDPDLPLLAVDWRKQRQLRALAAAFLATGEVRAARVRFDVVGVSWPRGGGPPAVVHITDAL